MKKLAMIVIIAIALMTISCATKDLTYTSNKFVEVDGNTVTYKIETKDKSDKVLIDFKEKNKEDINKYKLAYIYINNELVNTDNINERAN